LNKFLEVKFWLSLWLILRWIGWLSYFSWISFGQLSLHKRLQKWWKCLILNRFYSIWDFLIIWFYNLIVRIYLEIIIYRLRVIIIKCTAWMILHTIFFTYLILIIKILRSEAWLCLTKQSILIIMKLTTNMHWLDIIEQKGH
jgi:hypothetical protein